VVHGDNSSFIVAADSTSIGIHENIKCLSGLDLSDYELRSCTKDGFISSVLKQMENRVNHLM
jgi:hypothetical protein